MIQTKYTLAPQVDLQGDEPGGRVMIDTYSATLFACNETAWALLEALREGASIDDLVATARANFEVAEDEVRQEALALVHRLSATGLVDDG